MQELPSQLFTVGYLQSLIPEGIWFKEESPAALAGRCLLDVMEYLHTIPKFPGRFRQLANAHAVRLIAIYRSDNSLNRFDQLKSIVPLLNETLRSLMASRHDAPPFYGDDYWDWAAILECFLEAKQRIDHSVISNDILRNEMESFQEAVERNLSTGLATGSDAEWYGPATAVAAHRVLRRWVALNNQNLDSTLTELKKQALEMISEETYRTRRVPANLTLWHYGQVVHEFPVESAQQHEEIKNLSLIKTMEDKAYRVYALSRVIQGAGQTKDQTVLRDATTLLYKCQDLLRPLGQGLMGDNIKGSLNVLEALWPSLRSRDKKKIGSMIDALATAHSRANTIGIVVAIDREFEALRKTFESKRAHVVIDPDKKKFIANHSEYRVAVRKGKHHVGSYDAVLQLLNDDEVKWLMMVGIAGSLGTSGDGKPIKPKLGDLVIASSLAPYRIRDKVRKEIKNAPVPLWEQEWLTIPCDPTLFATVHAAATKIFPKSSGVTVYEGLVLTGTGIKDNLQEKTAILSEYPGGLAVEEEGWVCGLVSMLKDIPCIVIRSISDLAEGDKIKQQGPEGTEEALQKTAGEHAAEVAVAAIEILSQRW